MIILIFLGIFGLYAVYLFFGNTIAFWWSQNWWIVAAIGAFGILLFLFWAFETGGKTLEETKTMPLPPYARAGLSNSREKYDLSKGKAWIAYGLLLTGQVLSLKIEVRQTDP